MPKPLSTLPALLQSLKYSATPMTSFRSSRTERLVNPRRHPIVEDSYSAPIAAETSLSDEEILARFTRGFFGGVVFWPEKIILGRLGGWRIAPADFFREEGNNAPAEPGQTIWTPAEIPESTLLPRESTIVRTFQVTDSYLLPESPSSNAIPAPPSGEAENQPGYSYIDFAFATATFAGCHRFSVHRGSPASPSPSSPLLAAERRKSEKVELHVSHFHCNPTQDVEWTVGEYLNWFHQVYARMLTADGLRFTD